MCLVSRFVRGRRMRIEGAILPSMFEVFDHLLVQQGVVGLQCQHVVATRFDDLCRNLSLATYGVDGYRRPSQIDRIEQLGDGRDLIGLGCAGEGLAPSALVAAWITPGAPS
jgi:hypothetical protein